MKAKRVAELINAMAIARMNHDWLTASLICAELSAVFIGSKPCSDQLRAELTANNIEMNRLTERNDVILSTLRVNGLEPVNTALPLSDEQLRAGDWYCAEVSADVTQLLIDREISYCIRLKFDGMYVKYATPIDSKPTKEIIRKGNEFYYV